MGYPEGSLESKTLQLIVHPSPVRATRQARASMLHPPLTLPSQPSPEESGNSKTGP
jgi:hypothetical protein